MLPDEMPQGLMEIFGVGGVVGARLARDCGRSVTHDVSGL